jgi:hypothetical protein
MYILTILDKHLGQHHSSLTVDSDHLKVGEQFYVMRSTVRMLSQYTFQSRAKSCAVHDGSSCWIGSLALSNWTDSGAPMSGQISKTIVLFYKPPTTGQGMFSLGLFFRSIYSFKKLGQNIPRPGVYRHLRPRLN